LFRIVSVVATVWDACDEEWFFGQAGDIPVVTPGKWKCAW
jgi:hypothetical protein